MRNDSGTFFWEPLCVLVLLLSTYLDSFHNLFRPFQRYLKLSFFQLILDELDAAKLADFPFRASPTSSDSGLPRYNEITQSHLNALVKGIVTPYFEKRYRARFVKASVITVPKNPSSRHYG
ncbi:hypothetical protein SOMG_04057 [Schizosaccharomyces osmophilus]|uniref:Uncharacterized protein n=1 Tax=Schizosaccharomyces osmophilus TaxID=2545709 RepID=A0AAF0AXL0_9SCHI|nr:uncharacterized protein SOMG_04057 [Schizosaccharomyces osmophilus]WBW73924.1 hypothetical protein SOMG_04057 [Schizosaccharomyces osmophilus]